MNWLLFFFFFNAAKGSKSNKRLKVKMIFASQSSSCLAVCEKGKFKGW